MANSSYDPTKSPYYYYDPYTGEKVQAGYDPEYDNSSNAFKSKRASGKSQSDNELRASRDARFDKDLARYDAEAQKYTQQLQNAFRTQSETSQGLAQRGTQATVNQFLQRRGIDSTRGGLGASLASSTQAQLQGQTMQAQQTFSSTLYGLMQQQRNAFINGEFDFFRRIDMMGYEAELQKDILRFQARLQSDLNSRNMFGDILGLIGAVGASFLPGGQILAPAIMASTRPLP